MLKLVISLFLNLVFLNLNAYCVGHQFVDYEDKNSWFDVAKRGNVDLIEEFIQSGIDVDAVDENDQKTALIHAVEGGKIDSVKFLIKSGANVNLITKAKKCALISSICNLEILEFLISSGADVNIKVDRKRTPLHYAVMTQSSFSVEVICNLLKNGADINAIDLYGLTPLHLAYLNKEIMNTLLEHGANMHAPDDKGWTPLHLAYQSCKIDILREFIKRGASLNELTPNGFNALHFACFFGCRHHDKQVKLNLIQFLIEEQGMDVNGHSKAKSDDEIIEFWNLTAFMCAITSQNIFEDDFEILEYLISRGADFNAKVYQVQYGKQTFIQYGSVLSWAIALKQPRYIIEWLRQKGAEESPGTSFKKK